MNSEKQALKFTSYKPIPQAAGGCCNDCRVSQMRFLKLLEALFSSALWESDEAMANLVDCLTVLFADVDHVDSADNEDAVAVASKIQKDARKAMHDAVVAAQFYDRLRQRLDHALSGFMAMQYRLDQQDEGLNDMDWDELMEQIGMLISTEGEVQVFDKHAPDHLSGQTQDGKAIADNIEFF